MRRSRPLRSATGKAEAAGIRTRSRKPDWIRVKAPGSPKWAETKAIVKAEKLVTVCEEAGCPNIGEVLGKEARHLHDHGRHLHARPAPSATSRRACRSRSIPKSPRKVAEAVAKLGSSMSSSPPVDRDDLKDGGAQHFAEVIQAIRQASPAPPSRS